MPIIHIRWGAVDVSPVVRTINKSERWPVVLLPIKAFAKPFDRGAGDIIARVIGPIGGDVFKKWYKRMFGKDCGCGTRQDALNQRWPLGSENLRKSA